MWVLFVFLCFGVPGEQERGAYVPVAVYETEAECRAEADEWYDTEALPIGYGPRWTRDRWNDEGWFHLMPGDCVQHDDPAIS